MPLHELISLHVGKGIATKAVWAKYYEVLKAGTSEYDVLLNIPEAKLMKHTDKEIVDLILMNRAGLIKVTPGYDGVYGKPVLGEKSTQENITKTDENMKTEEQIKIKGAQKGLTDFI